MAESKELAGALFRVAEPKSERHPRFWETAWSRAAATGSRHGPGRSGRGSGKANVISASPSRQPMNPKPLPAYRPQKRTTFRS